MTRAVIVRCVRGRDVIVGSFALIKRMTNVVVDMILHCAAVAIVEFRVSEALIPPFINFLSVDCLSRLLASSIQSFSPRELAEKEAFALEGYAGAVGDDHDKAIKALRKASELLVRRTPLGYF